MSAQPASKPHDALEHAARMLKEGQFDDFLRWMEDGGARVRKLATAGEWALIPALKAGRMDVVDALINAGYVPSALRAPFVLQLALRHQHDRLINDAATRVCRHYGELGRLFSHAPDAPEVEQATVKASMAGVDGNLKALKRLLSQNPDIKPAKLIAAFSDAAYYAMRDADARQAKLLCAEYNVSLSDVNDHSYVPTALMTDLLDKGWSNENDVRRIMDIAAERGDVVLLKAALSRGVAPDGGNIAYAAHLMNIEALKLYAKDRKTPNLSRDQLESMAQEMFKPLPAGQSDKWAAEGLKCIKKLADKVGIELDVLEDPINLMNARKCSHSSEFAHTVADMTRASKERLVGLFGKAAEGIPADRYRDAGSRQNPVKRPRP